MTNKSPYSISAQQRGLHGQMLQELGLRIVRGDLQPGDVLPSEGALSLEYGVSRTVTREALKALTEKGMIVSRPKIGARILPRSNWNLIDADVLDWRYQAGADPDFIADLIDVRAIIEPAAAERAALRASDQEIAQIVSWYNQMAAATHEAESYIEIDMAFHNAILTATHNEMLTQMARTISAALLASRRITTQLPNSSEGALSYHLAVVDAIRQRDSVAAAEAMRRLLDLTARDIETALQQQGRSIIGHHE